MRGVEGDIADGGAASERVSGGTDDRSILDAITENLARLRQGLDPSDRSRLNAYLEDVREVERRIQKIEQYNMSTDARALPEAPTGVADSSDEHAQLGFGVQVRRGEERRAGKECEVRGGA